MDDFAKMVDTYRWRRKGDEAPSSPSPSPSPSRQETSPSFLLSSCEQGRPHVKVGNDAASAAGDDDDEHHQSICIQSFSSSPEFRSSGSTLPLNKRIEDSPSASSPPNRQLVFSVNDTLLRPAPVENEQHKGRMKIEESDKNGAKHEVYEEYPNVLKDYYSDSDCEDEPAEFWRLCNKSHVETCETPPDIEMEKASSTKKKVASRRSGSSGNVKSLYFHNGKRKRKAGDGEKCNNIDNKDVSEKCRALIIKASTGKRKKIRSKMGDDAGSIQIDGMQNPAVTESSKKFDAYIQQPLGQVDKSLESCSIVKSKEKPDVGNIRIDGTQNPRVTDSENKIDTYMQQSLGHVDESLDSYPIVKSKRKLKTSAFFRPVLKLLGQRHIMNKTWVPPVSVYALIQEELYKDPWKVLVACMLLNKTSGTQMRRAIWDLFDLCPTPEAAVAVEAEKIEDVIRPLGLQKKRAQMIQKFSKEYLSEDWSNVRELHGIGKYATDAYAIFCEGRWREVKPEDHKLVDYWKYLHETDGLGNAFRDDRENRVDVGVHSPETIMIV